MFQITVNTRRAIVGEKELITTRSAGIQVQFTFSEDWDSLAKFAIFRNGEDDESRVAMAIPSSGLVELPSENCAVDYIDEPIFAGVYGNDGLGTTIIPTIWASMGVLREGASYEGATPADPTPDMWAQILAIANEAHDTAEDCAEAEQLRAAAEELRVAAETARVAAENGRVSAEQARATAENLRATAEDLRVTAENARSAAEQNRATAEAARASAEASRQQNESTRQSNETARQTAESNRASAESTRDTNEQARRQAETARADAEAARADAETARVLAESARVAAEQARVNAENARGTAESARASAEALRASAESARASAEAARATAESNRADTFANWTTTFNGWQSTLDGKADQSALDALSGTVSNLNRQISELATDLTDLAELVDTKAPAIYETASGEIASFSDGADGMPMKSLVVNIEPVQDLHGYDYPWPGGGGKNLFDFDGWLTSTGATYTKSGNIYTITAVTPLFTQPFQFSNEDIEVTISYTDFADVTAVNTVIDVLNANGEYVRSLYKSSSPTVVTGSKLRFNWSTAGQFTIANMQIEKGSTQTSWTPYSNICPISGHTGASVTRTGKNLLPSMSIDETTYGVTWHVNEDNSISVSGTATRNSVVDFGRGHLTLKPGTYTTNRAKDGVVCAIWENSSPAQLIDGAGGTFVLTQDTPIFIRFYVPSGSTVNTTIYPQLELGSTVTDYEPYAGNQISITFPTESGTVYGGMLDVTNRVLTVDEACITIDGTNIQVQNNGHTNITTRAIFMANSPAKAYGVDNFISDKFRYTMVADIVGKANGRLATTGVEFYLPYDVPDTVAGVNAWFADNPTQLCYPLANPITYQLTESEVSGILETLYGTNNIWTDVGTVNVEYPADTRLFIEQLTKPTEDDMTADHAISSGTFFMIGNTLYLATSQIAAGGTITPGTNATQLSLADALNQLNA